MLGGTHLSGRGRTLLIVGALTSIAAAAIGERDLLWLTLFLILLPLLSFIYLLVASPKVSFERTLDPATLPLGSSTRVVLTVRNDSPAQAGALRFIDKTPDALAEPAAFTIARGFGAWRQAVGYSLRAEHRGRFQLGPLMAQASDPLGLATRRFIADGEPSTLRVTPRIWELSGLVGAEGLGASGDATPARIGQAGSDDVLVREHRSGDDMRRVHWKQSAKLNELMVRLEEHPWDPSSTLILDSRNSAHYGQGPSGSLEWAVSAVASLATMLIDGRFRVAIVSPSGVVFESGRSGQNAGQLMLEAMTELPASGETWLGRAVADPDSWTSAASLIAVTGKLGVADAAALAAAGTRARSLTVITPRVASWAEPSQAHAEAVQLLQSHGWRVLEYRPGESFTELWRRVPA